LTPPLGQSGNRGRPAFSPDGQRVAIAGGNTVWIRDAATGVLVVPVLKLTSSANAVQFDADGRRLVTGGDDGVARVWNAATGEPLSPPLRQGRSIVSATFSPEGRRILTASVDGTVYLWDLAGGAQVPPMRHG